MGAVRAAPRPLFVNGARHPANVSFNNFNVKQAFLKIFIQALVTIRRTFINGKMAIMLESKIRF